MSKLKTWIQTWLDGKKVRGIKVSLADIQELVRVYNAMQRKEKPEFINGKVKEILDKCQVPTIICGIGWKVI